MPELPEVETIARGLAGRISGDVIESVWLGQKPEPLKSPAREIATALEHTRIATVRRVGKHIVFDLEPNHLEPNHVEPNHVARAPSPAKARESHSPGPRYVRTRYVRTKSGNTKSKGTRSKNPLTQQAPADKSVSPQAQWIVHLGMTGRLQICEPQSEILKHTHAILKLASGRELRFVDPRRFGRLSVSHSFDAGGIEPLEAGLDAFLALFRGRKTPIKSALLNQKLLRGVGNIYADESLFRAGIRPRRRASTLTRDQLARLLASVKEVLREAIALGGSSISDYVDADGEEGFFQLQHRVYGREGEPCLVCETAIKPVIIAGRSSNHCAK